MAMVGRRFGVKPPRLFVDGDDCSGTGLELFHTITLTWSGTGSANVVKVPSYGSLVLYVGFGSFAIAVRVSGNN